MTVLKTSDCWKRKSVLWFSFSVTSSDILPQIASMILIWMVIITAPILLPTFCATSRPVNSMSTAVNGFSLGCLIMVLRMPWMMTTPDTTMTSSVMITEAPRKDQRAHFLW